MLSFKAQSRHVDTRQVIRRRHIKCQAAMSGDLAAAAVETVAAAALRSRLRSYGSVAVQISATAWDLMSGRIDGAKVQGKVWESPMGLTARVLDIQVGRAELDLPAVLTQQRITLWNTPLGSAHVVFNAADFGAFLQHPLVVTAARQAVQGRPFLFDRTGVAIVAGPGAYDGWVLFSGLASTTGQRYQLVMRPTQGGRAVSVTATSIPPTGPNPIVSKPRLDQQPRSSWQQQQQPASFGSSVGARAAVSASTAGVAQTGAGLLSAASGGSGDEDPLVSWELSRFFTGLLVDLQGAELSFREMRVVAGRAAAAGQGVSVSSGSWHSTVATEGLLELGLSATVRSFPPLNLQF